MIAMLSGILVGKSACGVIIEAGGVGYHVNLPTPDLGAMPAAGESVRVFTYLQVKDDDMSLYGFNDEAKKEMFIDLIGISGIGPKVAVAILSHLTVEELEHAIVHEDSGLISAAPGIGKKTAPRLVLELRERLADKAPELPGATDASALMEAREALVGLGYGVDEATRALSGAEPDQTVDTYLKFALRQLSPA